MGFGKKKKFIKKKRSKNRSSFIPLGVSSIRLLDFQKTGTEGYLKIVITGHHWFMLSSS
jgi:hypothetical protein